MPAPTDGVGIPDPVVDNSRHPQETGGSGADDFQPGQQGADDETDVRKARACQSS